MKILIILLFILAILPGVSRASGRFKQIEQPYSEDSLMIWQRLNIQSDPRINDLLRQEAAQSKKSGTISGFRLQIYFGSGEKAHIQAVKIKNDFTSSNPDIKTYLLFKSPDFIVRVGDFRTKSEALKLQKALIFQFPNAFIVTDDIAFPELFTNTPIN